MIRVLDIALRTGSVLGFKMGHVFMTFLPPASFVCQFLRPHLLTEKHMCDVMKQNESELANIDLEIEPNKGNKFFCFLLF